MRTSYRAPVSTPVSTLLTRVPAQTHTLTTHLATLALVTLLVGCDSQPTSPTPEPNPDAQANPTPPTTLCLAGLEKVVWTEDCKPHCELSPASPVFDQCYQQDGVDLGKLYTFGANSQPAEFGYKVDYQLCNGPSVRFYRMVKLEPQPHTRTKLYVNPACKPPWNGSSVSLPLPLYFSGVEVIPK